MKDLKFYLDESDEWSYKTKPIVVEVISEPYPLISRGFGAPPRNGGTFTTGSSTTCVVCKTKNNDIKVDLPVTSLILMED